MDRNYEQEYKKAFEAAKGLHDAGNALTKKQMEIVFPQLAESEDERIREWIANYIHRGVFDEEEHPNALKAVEWLEKQKAKEEYDRMMPIYNDRDSFEFALEKAWKSYNNSGARTVDGCEDDYVECAHAKGFREGFLYGIEKQKEQKSVQSEVEREYVRTLKSLISDFLRGKEDVDREYYQQIFDWLDGRHIEQKPAEVDESTKRLNENWMKQHFDDYKEQKPAEWSEEDELMIKCCFRAIEHYKYTWKRNVFRPSQFDIDGYLINPEKVQTWLKSLRNRVGKEYLQSHWKPTEEQMKALLGAEGISRASGYSDNAKVLASLYEELKRLHG